MIALGIDPGTAICGFGFVENLRGELNPINYGVITTSPQALMQDRLLKIHSELDVLIKTFNPDIVAVEKLFFGKNSTTAITVAQARGVVLLAAAQYNKNLVEITPNEVKQSVTGLFGSPVIRVNFCGCRGLNLRGEPDNSPSLFAVVVVTPTSRLKCPFPFTIN